MADVQIQTMVVLAEIKRGRPHGLSADLDLHLVVTSETSDGEISALGNWMRDLSSPLFVNEVQVELACGIDLSKKENKQIISRLSRQPFILVYGTSAVHNIWIYVKIHCK